MKKTPSSIRILESMDLQRRLKLNDAIEVAILLTSQYSRNRIKQAFECLKEKNDDYSEEAVRLSVMASLLEGIIDEQGWGETGSKEYGFWLQIEQGDEDDHEYDFYICEVGETFGNGGPLLSDLEITLEMLLSENAAVLIREKLIEHSSVMSKFFSDRDYYDKHAKKVLGFLERNSGAARKQVEFTKHDFLFMWPIDNLSKPTLIHIPKGEEGELHQRINVEPPITYEKIKNGISPILLRVATDFVELLKDSSPEVLVSHIVSFYQHLTDHLSIAPPYFFVIFLEEYGVKKGKKAKKTVYDLLGSARNKYKKPAPDYYRISRTVDEEVQDGLEIKSFREHLTEETDKDDL